MLSFVGNDDEKSLTMSPLSKYENLLHFFTYFTALTYLLKRRELFSAIGHDLRDLWLDEIKAAGSSMLTIGLTYPHFLSKFAA